MATYRVEIPGWRPVLLRELLGRNRYAVTKRKKASGDRVAEECHLAGVPRVAVPKSVRDDREAWNLPAESPGDPRPIKRHVRMTLFYPTGRGPDDDNPWKCLLDGLRDGGFIVDDSAEWLSRDPVRIEKGPKATVLEIEDRP